MGEIDEKSEQILRELTRNGRISNIELADRGGLSPSSTMRR
ncbi:MAG: AsnC family transcriptional regulator, partial [Pseudomonadota bacterium]